MFNFIRRKEEPVIFWSDDDWKHVPAGEFRCLGEDISNHPQGEAVDHWVKAPDEAGSYTFQYIMDGEDKIVGWRWVKDEEL